MSHYAFTDESRAALMGRRWPLLSLLLALSAFGMPIEDSFDRFATAVWKEASTHGRWTVQYNGYGTVGIKDLGGNKVLYESPKVSKRRRETHACLVLSTSTQGDLDATVRMRTVKQLRQGMRSNAWETAWVVWHYTNDVHFYYFTLKTNGWELGKTDPAYEGAQRYLKTGSSPKVTLGTFASVRVKQAGNAFTVWVDGQQVTTFTDSERPYADGHFGLYNEDASVEFDDVALR